MAPSLRTHILTLLVLLLAVVAGQADEPTSSPPETAVSQQNEVTEPGFANDRTDVAVSSGRGRQHADDTDRPISTTPFYSRELGLRQSQNLADETTAASGLTGSANGVSAHYIVDALLWLVGGAVVAVTAVFVVRSRNSPAGAGPANGRIRVLATQGVRNRFQVHLLEIGDQQFLVTTDRSGVRSVNAVAFWGDPDAAQTTASAA